MTTGPAAAGSVAGERLYAEVVGQEAAVAVLRASAARPVHAYLLVGPAGTGKLAAAKSFAAQLLCPQGGCGACPTCERVLGPGHTDLVVVQRSGAMMSVEEAAAVVRAATMAPVESPRKVIVLDELHLVEKAGPALLKTIEEPPATTVFVVLADHVPEDLVTIASRCVRVDFGPVPLDLVVARLQAEGVDAERATVAARAAAGSLERARLLATDDDLAARVAAWRAVPGRLDGTGATVAAVVDELRAMVDRVEGELLAERHAAEVAELAWRERELRERVAGARQAFETRQRRERRRLRTDELRLGLATLSEHYRDLLTGEAARARAAGDALREIGRANKELIRNPNEALMLEALLVRLGAAAAA